MPTINIKDIPESKIVKLADLSEDSINKIAEAVVRKIEVGDSGVVRCKDCKWYEESIYPELRPTRFCYRLKNDDGVPVGYNWDGNDFCSYGERREDEVN